ncbi:alpha/beta fold hydrolase [Dyadobacter fermentans]|uniref:alpha/beta fold hydrolase n=1 Tax=Dyadobacter fermentans TaxID=94254 RepID=UPI001CBB34B9|nr:alpha/beta hydrolase [Dyadobacter fermentans]MBZ1362889.1 alpha/beta hydrolase [Dyadobacter fermentans]
MLTRDEKGELEFTHVSISSELPPQSKKYEKFKFMNRITCNFETFLSGAAKVGLRNLAYIIVASLLSSATNNGMAQTKNESLPNVKSHISYRTLAIGEQQIFYREGGDKTNPALLFLHGFPSSSRMWQPLLEELSKDYYVLAPDLIGFGHSSHPAIDKFNYTFDNLSIYIEEFIKAKSLQSFVLIHQDYGGPIGMRIAEKHPEKVKAIIVQNAVCHEEGLSSLWDTRKAFWANKSKYYEAVKKNFISLEATKQRHLGSTPMPQLIDPDTYVDEYRFLNQPGMVDIQLNLFHDYQSNIKSYPKWQKWLQQHQPKMQVIWGKYDLSFTVEGAFKYKEDVSSAEVHIVEGGHFALDEQKIKILTLMQDFLSRTLE